MSKHILKITQPTNATPAKSLPDGAITGNGDVSVTLSGTADRIRIYISKADFWKADGMIKQENVGGIAPLTTVELLLPQVPYAEYNAEQNIDEAYIKLNVKDKNLDANVKITVCAEENVVLIELDKSFPAVSSSIAFLPIEGSEAITESGEVKDVKYTIRGFDTPECRFPTFGICALKQISRTVCSGREKIVWAITVKTNHDTAAYKDQAIERAIELDERICKRLLEDHDAWWKKFWSKSGVELPDETIELYWYASIYAVACCARNKKFPPGIWGGYSTEDGMNWFGDYHLNYNYEAPFYALTSSNHTELLECYCAPINDFLPTAKRFAEEFFGIKGSIFPVGLGPLGLETDLRPETKEHGHLFHGQKSNGAYAAVIPMMHWYGTRDKEFARREYYDFLLSIAEFWGNYLVFEDGKYQIYNDALNEVGWYSGPNHMPEGHDDKNPVVSRNLVRMIMKLMIDLSTELGRDTDKIPTWQHILDHTPIADTFESEGETIIRGIDGCNVAREISLEAMYPIGGLGKDLTPELFEAMKNTHRRLDLWDSHNRFCSYYPMSVRLGYPCDEILSHVHDVIENRAMPNGMIRYYGGGIENCAGIPGTVNEMLMQSYEGIVRLFPVWDRSRDARFHGLRAYGAFVINASLENGKINAEILSEQGMPLTIEKPADGYVLIMGDGRKVEINDRTITVNTEKGEKIKLLAE